MSKYYMAMNAGGRDIGGERFEITELFAGTAVGVFEGRTDEQIARLDAAMEDPKSAVSVISQQEYETALKKKQPSLTNFPTSNQTSALPMKGAGAVVMEATPIDRSEEAKLETVEAALGGVGAVAADAPEAVLPAASEPATPPPGGWPEAAEPTAAVPKKKKS